MIGTLSALAAKDLRLLFKDKGSLAVLFLLPLLFALILGAPAQLAGRMTGDSDAGESVPKITVALTNADTGSYGNQVAEALATIDLFDIVPMADATMADARVADGEASAAILIPVGFSAAIDRGVPTAIGLITDPAQEAVGDIVQGITNRAIAEVDILGEIRLGIRSVLEATGALEGATAAMRLAAETQTLGVIWTEVERMRREPLIEVRSEDLEGAETDDTWNVFSYYSPSFGVMFAFFLVSFMASGFLQEREQGLHRRLLVAPIPPAAIVAAKMLAYALIVFMQILLLFFVGAVFFGMPLGRSPLGLILVTLALSLASTSMGVMVGALAKSSGQAGNIGTLLGFVFMIVGGCVFPIFRTGGIVSVISYLTPHAHALSAYMGLMADDYTILQAAPHVAALLGFAALFSAIAVRRLRLT